MKDIETILQEATLDEKLKLLAGDFVTPVALEQGSTRSFRS